MGAGAGTLYGAIKASWNPDAALATARFGGGSTWRHALQVVTKPGLFCAGVAATYAGVECLSAGFRGDGKVSPKDSILAGMAAGFMMASTTKRFDMMAASAIGTGIMMGCMEFNGPDIITDHEKYNTKIFGSLPKTHVESEDLAALKDKYPKWKDL